MEGLQRRLSAFVRSAKSLVYEDVQNLVRDATSNDPVSAPDELIWKIIHAASVGSNNYAFVSEILWRRINDTAYPRHVYKGLTLLYHLLQHGENKNVFRKDTKLNIKVIEDLKDYNYFKEQGTLVNDIRRAAATIYDMVMLNKDPATLAKPGGKSKQEVDDEAKAAAAKPQTKQPTTEDDEKASKPKAIRKNSHSGVTDHPKPAKKPPSQDFLVPNPNESRASAQRRHSTAAPAAAGAAPIAGLDDLLAAAFETPVPSVNRQGSQTIVFSPAPAEPNPFENEPPSEPAFTQHAPDPFETFEPAPVVAEPVEVQRRASVQYVSKLGSEWGLNEEHHDEHAVVKPAPQPEIVKTSPTPAPVIAPVVPTPAPTIQKKSIKVSAAMLAELAAYARYINRKVDGLPVEQKSRLAKYLPLSESGADLLPKLEDGILLAHFINILQPNTIDLRALSYDVSNEQDRQMNANLVISAIQSLGVRTHGIKNLDPSQYAKPIMLILAGLIKSKLLETVNIRAHPELIVMLEEPADDDRLTVSELAGLSPENLLLKWFHYHLAKAGHATRKIELKDSACYAHLLNQITSAMPDEEFPPDPVVIDDLLAQPNLEARAAVVLKQFSELGAEVELSPADVVNGNPRLNLALTASLFNASTGLKLRPKQDADGQTLTEDEQTYEIMEKAGLLEEDLGTSREERAFRMWINSLDLEDVYLNNLGAELSDGLVLLRLINHIEPGLVDFKRVEEKPNSVFKKVSNNNYVVELGKQLGFSLVNVSGQDIVQGNKKLIMAFVWQLMRHHTIKFLRKVDSSTATADESKADHGRKSGSSVDSGFEKRVLEWTNRRLARARQMLAAKGLGHLDGTPAIQSFHDPSIATGRIFLDILWSINPSVIDWAMVISGQSQEDFLLNASYAISVARKLGCAIFLLPEDIVETNPKLVLTFLAAIMAVATGVDKI